MLGENKYNREGSAQANEYSKRVRNNLIHFAEIDKAQISIDIVKSDEYFKKICSVQRYGVDDILYIERPAKNLACSRKAD